MRRSRQFFTPLVALVVATTTLPAQSWKLRIDGAAQRVSFRGIRVDSIIESLATVAPSGGLVSPDGYAVTCPGDGYCHFVRPGAINTGTPIGAGIDLSMWGLGVEGLSVRVSTRAQTDLNGNDNWPGTAHSVRLVEGYAEYLRDALTLRAGRMLERGRLASSGTNGLDGLHVTWQAGTAGTSVAGYAGWGMARGSVLPVTSPAVNPLDEYRPDSRQIVFGAVVGQHAQRWDAQAEFRRELDPVSNYIVADRAALSLQGRPNQHVRLAGGMDVDLAEGRFGSAELSASYVVPRLAADITARHYRPFFDLWTVWGAFSPVAFNGVGGSVAVDARSNLQVRGRAEWFKYEDTHVSTPTVSLLDRGWRWGLAGTLTPRPLWRVELEGHGELLPGASSSGIDARVLWHARENLELAANGGSLSRPLELRFQDAGVTYLGASAGYRVRDTWRLDLTVDRYWESRDRPDAGAIDWNQWRLSARVSLALRSAADRWLPPARGRGTPP